MASYALRYTGKGNIEGVIAIKGVADYGDGEKKKRLAIHCHYSATFNYTKYKYQQVLPKGNFGNLEISQVR